MAVVLKKDKFVLNLALEFGTARQTVLVRSPDVPGNLANGGRDHPWERVPTVATTLRIK